MIKKLLSLLLAISILILPLGLTACTDNGGEVEDNGGDGIEGDGENNAGATADVLELIKGGVAKFNIVSAQNDTEINDAIGICIDRFAGYGVEVKSVADYAINKKQDCEILIGTGLVQRDSYNVDVHDFGERGYVIKVVDQRVVICGGSTDATVEALFHFIDNYFGITMATTELTDVSIAKTLFVQKVQDDYELKDVIVGGESIRGAYISATRANSGEYAAAQVLQAALYSKAGIWLDIRPVDEESKKKIQLNLVDDEGEGGFRVFVNNGELTVNAEYDGTFERGMNAFLASAVNSASGTVDFALDYTFTSDISFVRYSEFGAKGNGYTDDLAAIVKTHHFANSSGLRVEADPGATYYIGAVRNTAIIQTDVDWGDATFIIDDRDLTLESGGGTWVFKATPDLSSYSVEVPEGMTVMKDTKNIGITFDTDVMLQITDSNKRVFYRSGLENGGVVKSDVIIVKANGDVDPTTPPLFDFDTVTALSAQPINDTPITISGGTFVQYPNHQDLQGGYFKRGIAIARSNTTVYNLKFYFEKWPDAELGGTSSAYEGFLTTTSAYNVLYDSCQMSGRLYYQGGKGTYGIGCEKSIKVTWYNCTQLNDINNTKFWGIMGSNGSKNLTYDSCYLSRFDVHAGSYNVTIKDSTIGEIINLVGWGKAYLENVKLSGANNPWFIRLREDFGAIWDGEVIIKNCELVLKNNITSAYIFRADWTADHWYGYDVILPNVVVDGFKITHQNGNDFNGQLYVFKKLSEYSRDLRYDDVNPLTAPATVSLKGVNYNVSMVEGTHCEVIFSDTVFTHTRED